MGYLDEPKNLAMLRKIFNVSLVVVILLEFILVKREPMVFSIEHIAEIPTFHAFYGFIACSLIILVSKAIGHAWLMVEEDYYD
jgi:hypothetical protein